MNKSITHPIPGQISEFVKKQIEISKKAREIIFNSFGSPNFLDEEIYKLDLSYLHLPLFIKPKNLKENERIGIRKNRKGENVYVVEDSNGSFLRIL